MASNPKSKKKKLPKSTTEMSKEMLQETLKKKRECNAKALSIVERLCENAVEEEWFLSNLEFINQSHLEDAIVERTLVKLCGYPLCDNELGDVPAKKYHISTRYNKVFDITERKNYCSSICYKAAVYIKNQLLTSPLWFRDQEEIPKFELLKCFSSSIGEEVVLREEIPAEKDIDRDEVKDINRDEVKDINWDEVKDNDNDEEKIQKACDEKNEIDENLIKNFKIEPENNEADKSENGPLLEKSSTIEVKRREPEPHSSVNDIKSTELELSVDPVSKVEQCVHEWFNLSSMLCLLGEEKVKELLRDKKHEIKEALKCTTMKLGYNERIDRMINFFSVLDIQLSNDSGMRDLKPLPDYSIIKEEGKTLEVKVRAFFKGQLEIQQPEEKRKEDEINENQEPDNIYLPLVDAHAQNALRRRILLDKLNRILPELLRTFAPDFSLDMSDVRNLVSNFTLGAHNITFKPAEWYLVGIILIKLLSLKLKRLKTALETQASKKHLTLLLMSYNLKEDYLDNIVEWLMNSDSIINKLNHGLDVKNS